MVDEFLEEAALLVRVVGEAVEEPGEEGGDGGEAGAEDGERVGQDEVVGEFGA